MSELLRETINAAERLVAGEDSPIGDYLERLLSSPSELRSGENSERVYLAALLDVIGLHDESVRVLRGAPDATSRNMEGMLAAAHGRHTQARDLLVEALDAATDSPLLRQQILANLAAVSLQAGSVEEAEAWIETAVTARQAGYPAADVLIATVQATIASYRGNLSALRSAAASLEEASKSRLAELGIEHPQALAVVANMASTEIMVARAENSAVRLERAIDVLEVAAVRLAAELGADHPQAKAVMANLAAAMAEPAAPPVTFAVLLQNLRIGARLTQEELAEATSVSPRSISDLERGIAAKPRRDTVRLLADGLGLAGSARAEFEAVAQGRSVPVVQVTTARAAATRTLPRDVALFTGRQQELEQLAEAAAGSGGVVGIHAIGGMAGVGKTALAVHVAHQYVRQFPDGQVFLQLHGHTPGQRPVEPADALASLLQTTGVAARQIPPGTEARAGLWRAHLAGKKLLLVLDDAVDSDQVRPLLPGAAGSLVLITSRRHLTALDDVRSISLDTMEPDEAATLLVRLAARPGLEPGDGAVREIIRLTACLPLAVGMMAGQLHHHSSWTAADLAAELTTARDRLEFMVTENRSVAAAFDLSYARLSEAQQRLYRRLVLHPGPDVDAYAAAALDDAAAGPAGLSAVQRELEALYESYLLTKSAPGRYRFHDLIREHARTLAAADPAADRDAAAARLAGYFLHTARLADRHLARYASAAPPGADRAVPRHAPVLATREDAVTWMELERLNLQAAAAAAPQAGQPPGYAAAMSAAMHGFLRVQGHWDQAVTLHELAIQTARQDGDRLAEAEARTELAAVKRLTGDYAAAGEHLQQAIVVFRELDSRRGQANALQQLGNIQYLTGDYLAAARSLTQAVEHFRELGDHHPGEGSALRDLGAVQALTGDYPAATASLTRALEVLTDPQDRANALNYLGAVQRLTGDYQAATASETEALELFRSVGNRFGEAAALGDLGLLQTLTEDYPAALSNLRQAFEIFRDLEHLEGQASVLNDLGTVQARTGDHAAALDNLNRALEIYSNLGHLLGQAEVLNSLGEAVLAQAGPRDAQARHREALDIAVSIASPPEEARALEGIGRCQLLTGEKTAGTQALGQALAIYQRINSSYSKRVSALLRDQDAKPGGRPAR